jgi:hypothetical protein
MLGMNTDAKSERAAPLVRCPGCRAPADRSTCPVCGIWLAGPQATELQWIDSELRRIDAAKAWLLDRRTALLADVAQISVDGPSGPQPHSTPRRAAPGPSTPPPSEAAGHIAGGTEWAQHELSGRAVGRLLLVAGAVLVLIATTVFTVANWSSIGPLGRCGILLVVTAVMLAVPIWLRRRVLTATAETVTAIGLALTIADGYLTLRLFRVSGLFVLAAMCAGLAVLWAAYGLAARLRTPRLAAIAAAQFPGLIATIALARVLGGTSIAGPPAIALIVTSAADLVVSGWASRRPRSAMALTSSIAAAVMWVAAMLVAATVLLSPHGGTSRPGVIWMSGVLVGGAAIGVSLLPRTPVAWLPTAPITALSGGLLAIGLALPAARAVPSGWEAVPFALAGAVVAGAALVLGRVLSTGDPGEESEGSPATAARLRLVAAASAATAAAAGLTEAPAAVFGMFPLHRLTHVWSGPALPPAPYATSHVPGALAPGVALGLVSLACWMAPLRRQSWARPAALAVAGLAAGSIPAAGLTGWAAMAVLTAAAAMMLGASTLDRSPGRGALAITAACSGISLAASAVLWSLTWAAATITELAVLTVIFSLAAASAAAGQLAIGCAVAAATLLAWAVPLASGQPVRYAAFAVLGVAVAAVATATLLRRVRPGHADVLDIGAGFVALLAALMAARHSGTFAVLAAIAALTASSIAWLRTGRRRVVVLCGAIFAALAAVAAEGRPIALTVLRPYAQLAAPWHGPAQAAVPGVALAVIVVGACAAAMTMAAGAWRGRQASLDALALALPVVAAPAGLAGGLGYGFIVGLLLVLALALGAWASASRSLAPAGAALAAATFALAWALAAPVPTLIVLGCLSVASPLCVWRARRPDVRVASACLSVLSAAALAEATAMAAGWPAGQAGLAVLGVAACAQVAAGLAGSAGLCDEQRNGCSLLIGPGQVPSASTAIEATAWLAVVAGTVQCLSRPGPASLALAISGLIAVGVAIRADRRPALWVGLALCQAAWCVWLFTAGVSAPEPYTVPAAAAWIARCWHLARRLPRLSSWLAYGPGLALMLLPSLIAVWHGNGWIRPLLLGLAAAGLTLIGGRVRLQAPLLIGAAAAALDAGHELAPAVRRLAEIVPTWLPIAVTGAILIWAGATYEARLRNLSTLHKIVAAMG